MTDPTNGSLRYRLDDLNRRLSRLEDQDVSVLAERVKNLEARFKAMTTALWSTAGALLLAALTFAITSH